MRATLSAALVVGVGLGSGCAGGTQSCATPSRSDPETCIEFNVVRALGPAGLAGSLYISALCEVIGADAAPGSCPVDGRVGGCRDASDGDVDIKAISWSYTGSLASLSCDGDDTKVDPDGVPVSTDDGPIDGPGSCSEAGNLGPATVVFANETGADGSLYWVDPDCIESAYAQLALGDIHQQATFVGHVWVLRAGLGDPDGDILWEGKVEASDDGNTIPMD